MKFNPHADLAAKIQLSHQKVHRAVADKIQSLHDGGLDEHEIAAHTGIPLYLVRMVLRGGAGR